MRVERGVNESTETSSSSACLRPPTTLPSAECEIGHETLQTPSKDGFPHRARLPLFYRMEEENSTIAASVS
jgi:hypothetical protein